MFKREKNDLVVTQEILMTTAALGGEIVVPTLDGQKIKLKIRPGVQSGRRLTIPERGVPINRNLNDRGNLDVVLNVKTLVPENPTQTALLEALADAFNDKLANRTDADWQSELEDSLNNEKYQEVDEKDLHPSKLARIGKVLGKFFNFDADKLKRIMRNDRLHVHRFCIYNRLRFQLIDCFQKFFTVIGCLDFDHICFDFVLSAKNRNTDQ